MPLSFVILLFILAATLSVGLAVILTNPRRQQNRQFFLFSLSLVGWVLCVLSIIEAKSKETADLFIRLASVCGASIPLTFHLLCLSIQNPHDSLGRLLRRARWILVAGVLIGGLCFTPLYMSDVILPDSAAPGTGVPRAVYGPGFVVFTAFFPVSIGLILVQLARRIRRAQGAQRVELLFTFIGMVSSLPVAVLTHVAAVWLNSSDPQQYGPLCIIPMTLLIAYGIATRRLMDVTVFFQRAIAFSLALLFLVALYFAVYGGAEFVRRRLYPVGEWLPHLLATLAVAFSMAPTHGLWQRIVPRLLGGTQIFDAGLAMQRAGHVLQSITTIDELLQQLAAIIVETFQAEHVAFWLADKRHFCQRYPAVRTPPPRDEIDPLARWLRHWRTPLVPDLLRRTERHPLLAEAAASLAALEATAAVGIFSKTGIEGFLLLGPRHMGRIYGADEQNVLQVLCNQLAIALENARLYTQVQEAKVYNEILLDSLVSGVVAVDAERTITLFNREAQRLTGLAAAAVLSRPVAVLPAPLADALRETLEQDVAIRNRDLVLTPSGRAPATVRLGSSVYHGHDGAILGAMIVFSDLTALKQLEEQVRRSDRLASLGTLSAGMAHEIKNPLVTIKTYAHLLPERYEDPDFRNTFSSLLGHEVQRIDTIVNQLLSFARPTKAALSPVPLHDVLDQALRLLIQPIHRKKLHLARAFDAPRDRVNADRARLHQAFINFLLNAIEATDSEGQITVTTDSLPPADPGGPARVRVTVRDTGQGIPAESLPHIFDPFYTTKSEGTGLGLSVAHSIIEEHAGTVDVTSTVGQGTAFFVVFPLLNEEAGP